VNYFIDKPDIVRQLRAADPKNPALEGYIYEAMRKAIPTRVWTCAKNYNYRRIGIDPPFRGVYRESFGSTRCTSLRIVQENRWQTRLLAASRSSRINVSLLTLRTPVKM
jgi:hypothetical protein